MRAQVEIRIGRYVPTPVSETFMRAVQSITVHQVTVGRSTFQIALRAERSLAAGDDYAVMAGLDAPATPSMRVIISAASSEGSSVLIDGFILDQRLDPGGPGRPGSLVLSGEDVSVQMDLYDNSQEFPGLADAEIVLFNLLKYPTLGLIPMIVPPVIFDPPNPLERIPFQQSSDYKYISWLAGQYGYVFRVQPGPVAGTNIAYWGPTVRVPVGPSQPALTVSGAIGSNVTQIQFSYDAMQASTIYGEVLDEDLATMVPIETVLVPSDPLVSRPPILVQGLFHREQYRDFTSGGDAVRAYAFAFGQVLQSQQTVAKANGTLDVFRYGSILQPYQGVGVRGAGDSYDGIWYVEEVTHVISPDGYKNQFQLTRGGLGSLVDSVNP